MMSSWGPEKKYSDPQRWICIYPAYINSKKTLAEGRRLPKDKCIENPIYTEMRDVLQAAGLEVIGETKMYPRDPNRDQINRGRVRIHLRNDDGTPTNSTLCSKTAILSYCCEMIPKLKSRQKTFSEQSQQSNTKKNKGKKGKR